MASAASSDDTPAILRVVSWNIGLRGLTQLCTAKAESSAADVHGISRGLGFGSLAGLLRAVDADIVCLQEVKMAQLSSMERAIALAEGYDSFFSLCRAQTPSTSYGRYAGVATFVRTAFRPHTAEEGVTGVLARGGAAAKPAADPPDDFFASLAAGPDDELSEREIDSEGRCVVTVHGDLAICNAYVPANTSDDAAQQERRMTFKLAFLRALERRARRLLADGMRVLLLGDFNIAPERIDSARRMQSREAAAPPGPSTLWLHQLMRPSADGRTPFADAFRVLHPTAREAYTCFHVAAGADKHNFGSRIDLGLLAPPPTSRGAATATAILQGARASGTDDGALADPFAPRPPRPPTVAVGLCECTILRGFDQSDHLPLRLVLSGVHLPPTPPPPPPLSSAVRLGGQTLLSRFVSGAGGAASSTMDTAISASASTCSTASTSTGASARSGVTAPALPAPPQRTLKQTRLGVCASAPPPGGTAEAGPAGASGSIGAHGVGSGDGGGGEGGASSGSQGGSSSGAAWHAFFQRQADKVPVCRGHREPMKKQTVRKTGANQVH